MTERELERLRARLELSDFLLDELLRDQERDTPSVRELLAASVEIQKRFRAIDRRVG